MTAAAQQSSWSRPAAIVTVAVLALSVASALWATAPGPVTVPSTPVELAATLTVAGCFLLGRRPGHPIAALIAVTGLLFCAVTLAAAVLDHAASAPLPAAVTRPALAVAWLTSALAVPWMLLVLWFPDGRFVTRGWRRLFAAVAVVAVGLGVAGYLFGPPGGVPAILAGTRIPAGLSGPFAGASRGWLLAAVDATAAAPLLGLPALVTRYRRGDTVVRQQIRWLLAAAVVTAGMSVLAAASAHAPEPAATVVSVAAAAVQPLPALAVIAAVLRYRLWDIDVVVSRALVYGVLVTGLSVLLLVPAFVSGYLVGGAAALTAVGVALVVTLAFQPLQRRLQRAADAWVYGRRRRGLQELARVGEALRTAVDVEEVGATVAATLREALQVPWAVAWVHVRTGPAEGLRPVGGDGIEALPVRLSSTAAAALRGHPHPALGRELPEGLRALLPAAPGLWAPLVAGDELVGLLACGERVREPLGEDDVEPLARFARECALGLRGLRLETELRARLDEIEVQAAELRSSRQRLVRAQDEERRRIERNLHDGVQQQLVGLAAGLRRLAGRAEAGPVRGESRRLADEAEDAVFALQDLGRGIFPAVLTDHGLAAALRAHAGRTPLPVRVDIEPCLSGRRFDGETEAALFFVALEALTNVAKHAPEASASVLLHTDEAAGELVLEVHDDGPGLPRSPAGGGVGLVNMRDRVAAVGGALHLDSRRGAGTWVRAAVPLPQRVVALRPADADSRR